MCRLIISVLLVLCSALSTSGSTCTLPAVLQTSTWEYNKRPDTPLILTFGPSTLSGLVFDVRGTELSNFTCISNVNNVFVFRSTFPYSEEGNDRYLFLCMRLSQVTKNSFYFYLLSDIDTTNDVIPHERVLNPPWNNIPPDSNPTCSFCQYTTPPNDIHTFRRPGTYDGIPYDTRPCLPCEAATCNATVPMIYPTNPMKYPTYPMKYPTYPMKDPTYPMKYPTYPMKYHTNPRTYPPNPMTHPPTKSTSIPATSPERIVTSSSAIPTTSPKRIMKTSAIHETHCPVRCRNVVGEESIQETKISNMLENGPPLLDMD